MNTMHMMNLLINSEGLCICGIIERELENLFSARKGFERMKIC